LNWSTIQGFTSQNSVDQKPVAGGQNQNQHHGSLTADWKGTTDFAGNWKGTTALSLVITPKNEHETDAKPTNCEQIRSWIGNGADMRGRQPLMPMPKCPCHQTRASYACHNSRVIMCSRFCNCPSFRVNGTDLASQIAQHTECESRVTCNIKCNLRFYPAFSSPSVMCPDFF